MYAIVWEFEHSLTLLFFEIGMKPDFSSPVTTVELSKFADIKCSSGFPYFLLFKSEFWNKELTIWAIDSSRSCFYWLYRVSSSSTAKNITKVIELK